MATELRPGYEIPGDPLPESRWVEADERCPHPEFWHSTDGSSTEVEVSELIAGLVRGLQPRLCIETGSAYGQTTRAIARALEENGHGLLVTYEVDDEQRNAIRSMVDDRHVLVAGDSLKGSLDGFGPLDFAFLDSNYETRVPEFNHFRRWMRLGTIVAFHDTRPGAGEHRMDRSLREELDGLDLALIDLPTPRGLTLGAVS